MNNEVTTYINNAVPEQKKIMEALRKLIHGSIPGIEEEYKWSRPVFRTTRDLVYLKTAKAYVTFGFFNAQELADPDNLLEGTGKDMRHIKIRKVEDINEGLIKGWLAQLASS